MGGEDYGILPSTANHCEICGFHEVRTPEDAITVAEEGAAVVLFINEEQLGLQGLDIVSEMHRNLPARRILEAKFCAHCIQAGLCRTFRAIPDDLNPNLNRIVRKIN